MFVDRPPALPTRRLLMKCPHSCATIWLSSEPSRRSDVWRASVSVTGPPASAALSAFAVASVTDSTGIVTVPDVPEIVNGVVPPVVVSARITPIAPAPCAFDIFTGFVQLPRSSITILPATWAAFVSPAQPSPAGGNASSPTMSEPVTLNVCGPMPPEMPAV